MTMPIGNTPQSTHRVLPEVPRSPMARRSDPAPEVFVKVEPTHQPIRSGASPPRRTAPGGMPAQAAAPPVLAHQAPGTALTRILWRASCWARSCRCRSRSSWWRRIPSCCMSSRLRAPAGPRCPVGPSSAGSVMPTGPGCSASRMAVPYFKGRSSGRLGGSHQCFGQRFDSAQLHSPAPGTAGSHAGLQWFRRGIRRVTEACSVRANT